MTTLATLDGSLRTTELGTLEAIDLCETIARTYGRAACNPAACTPLTPLLVAAVEAYELTQSDDETAAEDAREQLDWLMYETVEAMHELGYLAYWEDSIFRIETINDESETN